MTEQPEIRRGLAGVVVDTTSVSMVNPDTNSLTYRGYPVQDLAANASFEAVAWLLWHGELPTAAELDQLNATERDLRAIDDKLALILDQLPLDCHPMDVLRTAVSYLGAADPTEGDASREALLEKSVNLYAKLPTIVAREQRRRRGLEPVEPDASLGYSENFLKMTFGEVPAPDLVSAFEVSMVLYAEHSFNASTFTARVVTSTLSDLYSAVTAGIGALKGPLHGGANEAVMHTFEEIGAVDNVEGWLQDAFDTKKKIMGFGHRVYKKGDSRVPTMHGELKKITADGSADDLMATYDALQAAMLEAKNIHPNLDYPAGPVYHLMGFDIPMFTPLFVMSRITGWTAHIIEQLEANALIRPLSQYVGPDQREVPTGR